jgi:hypothetical protein
MVFVPLVEYPLKEEGPEAVHANVAPGVPEVSVTDEDDAPEHMVCFVDALDIPGIEFTVMFIVAVFTHPFAFVPFTV